MAITHSGSGLHPYWRIAEDTDDDSDDNIVININPSAFLNRWKRLVKMVAKSHGAKVDSVFDLPRVLRVPGTFNNKASTNGHGPIPVVCHRGSGVLLRLGDVHRRFDDYGIHDLPNYPDPEAKQGEPGYAKILSTPDDWTFAGSTCNYMTETISGWGEPNTVEIGTGRHPWLTSGAVRLACAKRLQCLNETDYDHAKDVLIQTFKHLVANREPIRPVGYAEIKDIFTYGINKAATKTDAQAREELGNHKHEPEIDEEEFWDSRQLLLICGSSPGETCRSVGNAGKRSDADCFGYPAECGSPAGSRWRSQSESVRGSRRGKRTHQVHSMSAAQEWLTVDPQPKPTKPATGEGLANLYADVQKVVGVSTQVGLEWSVLARIPEVETLTKTGARSGSTIMSELRSGFSGERLGHDYRSANRITICDHRYRLAMTVGVQPHLAKPLLDDVGAGTPQRFVWLPVNDPGAPEKTTEAVSV